MKNTAKIYVDIESLLDIRQGVLYTLVEDKEKLAEFLNSEEYNFRSKDSFSIVNRDDYTQANINKTIDVLPFSTVTYILNSIKSKINNLEKRNTFYNETRVPEILLNIHPFKLSEEQTKYIQNLLFVKLESNTMVTVVDITPEELSPFYIKNAGIISCFIYDFSKWMNKHSSSLEKNKINDIMMYFPSIQQEEISDKELNNIIKLGFKDVFSYLEFLISSVANINFLPTVFYSNLITANAHLDKFNMILKNKSLSKDGEEFDPSTIPEIP